MKNMRSFTVTALGWTNTKPARIRIYDNRNRESVIISYYNSLLDRHEEIACEWLRNKGIICPYLSEGREGFLLLTHNFKTQIK